MSIEQIDQQLLTMIQVGFPVAERPFQIIGQKLGLSEAETLERLSRLRQEGVIRRLGALLDSRKVGYGGTLCALRVPEQDIERVAAVVNSYSGITHNYLRDCYYNMWFTLLTPSQERTDQILNEIKQETGLDDLLVLPTLEVFKILVNFDLSEVQSVE